MVLHNLQHHMAGPVGKLIYLLQNQQEKGNGTWIFECQPVTVLLLYIHMTKSVNDINRYL